MLIRTKNQQKTFCYLFGYQISSTIFHSPFIFNNKKAHHYSANLFTYRNIFHYRSQQKFIDFKKDYYDLLGIQQTATLQQIKQQFYHLAKQYHPDRNKGNQSKFKQISEAYNILSQPNLRKDYDSNRYKQDETDSTEQSTLNNQKTKGNLNYGAYSQMSKAQWAIYRSGFMKHSTADYTNYRKVLDLETNNDLEMKKSDQWRRAFRNLTVQQLQQEVRFRQKLYKKYCEDLQAQKKAKERFIDERLEEVGKKIEKILGKRVRSIYDNFIKK